MKLKLVLALMSVASSAFAHPVSYKGALAVMTWNQPFISDHWVNYSFRPDMAIAARAMRMDMPEGEFETYMPQLNYLLKRWNGKEYQANIYTYGGYGHAKMNSEKGRAWIGGIEADAESTKYFILAKAEFTRPTVGPNFDHYEARVGIAPYEAEFDELASWFMIQYQRHPALAKHDVVTPMARFFYRNALIELGVSLDGDYMTNLMFHF